MNLDACVIIVHKKLYLKSPLYYYKLKFRYNVYVYNSENKTKSVNYYTVVADTNDYLKHEIAANKPIKLNYEYKISENLTHKTSCTSGKLKKRTSPDLPTTPRLIIWTVDDPLLISGTWVYRCPEDCLPPDSIFNNLDQFRFTKSGSCVIFDLDDTLIRSDSSLIPGMLDLLLAARRKYNYVVLWSHGSDLHVIDHVLNEVGFEFDYVIYRNKDTKNAPKNPFYLYALIKNYQFTSFTLVDDLIENATDGYDEMYIPILDTNLTAIIPAFIDLGYKPYEKITYY